MQLIRAVVLLAVCLCSSYRCAGLQSCQKTGPCSCESEQGVIDLSPLQSSPSPRFKDRQSAQGGSYLYSYNPCLPFDEQQGCKSVAACQLLSSGVFMQYPIGTQDSATFSLDVDKNPVITYTAKGSDTIVRTTMVTLVCDKKGGTDKLDVAGETTQETYKMTLTSQHCCPKKVTSGQLSAGSILLIIVLCTLVLYIVVGVAIQVGVRKASGKEVVPNYAFWVSVPGLIKDGVLFTCWKCRGRSGTYQSI